MLFICINKNFRFRAPLSKVANLTQNMKELNCEQMTLRRMVENVVWYWKLENSTKIAKFGETTKNKMDVYSVMETFKEQKLTKLN